MTLEEAGAIMDVLKVAYPQHYSKATEDEKFLAVQLWTEMFAAEPVAIVIAAVKSFLATDTKGWPPTIGMIKDHILKLTSPQQKSALEAWAEVKSTLRYALRDNGKGSSDGFGKLDAVTQRIIGSPSQLREWALVNVETLDTVIASNFRESYNASSKHFRDLQALPPAVSEMVGQLAAKMDMNGEAPKQLTEFEAEKKRAEILRLTCNA